MLQLTRRLNSYFFFTLLLVSQCWAESIHIATASNFRTTLQALIDEFQHNSAHQLTLSSASTGVLAAQITQGAPFDLLFAADKKTPQYLAEKLKLAPPQTYAIGSLALWCPQGSPTSLSEPSQLPSDVALADVKHAPYGLAAEQVIQKLNWPASIKRITATNIAQVSLFVNSGAASCGFIAQSLISPATKDEQLFNIPTQWHDEIAQQALVVSNNPLAVEFLNYVLGDGQKILLAHGYQVPLDKQ